MSSERAGKSHAMAWVVTILVAVPMFYILSVPPLTYVVTHYSARRKSDRSWMIIGPPSWLRAYTGPYRWLRLHTPLAGALQEYGEWCGCVVR